jgi:hypothetical protein
MKKSHDFLTWVKVFISKIRHSYDKGRKILFHLDKGGTKYETEHHHN